MKNKSPRVFAIGERVTVQGYHKNYRPVIAEIVGDMVRLRTPEIPDTGDAHFVKVNRLEELR